MRPSSRSSRNVGLSPQAGNLLVSSGVDMARYLFVVSRARPELADYLERHFSEGDEGLITVDRRRGERRGGVRGWGPRRLRPENDAALTAVGAFMVPLDAEEPVA